MSFGMHARNVIAGQGRYIADKAPATKGVDAMSTKEKIEARWLARAEASGMKPNSMLYRRAECEFFAGAMAALDAADDTPRPENELSGRIPPIWVINIISGRPVVEKKP
jgi:hypothetical protein